MAVGGALFGPTARSQPKGLVEFKAGKMTFDPTTKMVSPDKRKGLLTVLQCDDQLMHLQWKDRTTGKIEEDSIVYPKDVEFKWVPACTTGRVFVLKFKTSNKRIFFWMQEPNADKDEEYAKKVNDTMNNPPAPGSARSGGGPSLASGLPARLDFNNPELQSLVLDDMIQQQLQVSPGITQQSFMKLKKFLQLKNQILLHEVQMEAHQSKMEANQSKMEAHLAKGEALQFLLPVTDELDGACDALERKYLKELVLIVYLSESCPEVVHEMYSFKFSYPRGEVSCQITQGFGDNKAQSVKQDDLLKSTQSLLTTIIDLIQELGPLPSSAFMSVKLMYYDEVTPEDYEPSGFKPSEVKDFQN